ncbi:ABC transporter permease [Antribacter gilvus]|uniref:ABC transporter permease n=1 Tax=Antribacter gilvus TaxID=2304675 RepID=UPI000F79FA06|nr:ABC transporter permease [Antribacter gilvus]
MTATTNRPQTGATAAPEASNGVGHGNRGAWLIVMNREIVVRALNKSFLMGLVISLVMIAGLTGFFAWQSSKTDTFTVAVTAGDTAALAAVEGADDAAAEADQKVVVEALEVADDDAARAVLEEEDADAWLQSGEAAGEASGVESGEEGWTLSGWREPDSGLSQLLTSTVETQTIAANAAEAGTTMDALSAGATLDTQRLDGNAIDPQVVFIAGFVLAFLFYLGTIGSGTMIAGSVIEEKQSRLAEIIATAVPLRHVLAGKILGSSVIALAQNLLFAAVGLIGLSFTDLSTILPSVSASLIWFVVFFTVGFLAVAALYAVAGALASRTEDLQHTTGPVMFLLIGIYIVTFSAEGVLEVVLSYVPLTSIVSMPVRVLAGEALWWEPAVSLVIMAAFTAASVLVCERAYRGALLQTGGRLTWRKALAAEG